MLELLYNRRSIRKYKQEPVDQALVEQIMKAALLAPSSKKSQPWEFILVRDKEKLAQLAKSRDVGAAFVKDAPLAIVVVADPNKSTVWVEDASIAATLIQLEAEALGLGSCWVQVRNRNYDNVTTTENYIRSLLEIPGTRHVACMIALGYPDEKKTPYTPEDLPAGKVFTDTYGSEK